MVGSLNKSLVAPLECQGARSDREREAIYVGGCGMRFTWALILFQRYAVVGQPLTRSSWVVAAP